MAGRGVSQGQTWEIEVGGLRLPLEATLEIGRDPACSVPLEDELVSWRHLRVSPKDGQLEVIDLESSNGTFLNGRQLDPGPTYVNSDVLIQLGAPERGCGGSS